MTLLQPQSGDIPAPFPSVVSQPFWDGTARERLLFQRCADCAAAVHTPALVCSACGSRALAWEESAGRGQIYSWTTIWRPQTPAFTVPYVAVIVDVAEGWQLLSNLIGCDHEAAAVGLPVRVVFHHHPAGFTLPYVTPT